MELGLRILIISADIPHSLSCTLDSKAEDSGLQAKLPGFQTKLRPEGQKNFFWRPVPHRMSQGLYDRPPPPLSEGLDPPLPDSLTWGVNGATRSLVNSVFGLRVLWVKDLWNLESWALESGIQLKESGIPLTIGIWNPYSLIRSPESSTWSPESTTWNPKSKAALDNLYTLGERYCCWHPVQSV